MSNPEDLRSAEPEECPLLSVDEALLTNAIVFALDKVLDDKERMRKFSRILFDAFVDNGVEGSKKWIGAKVLAAIGAMLFGAGLYLLGKYGAHL